MRSPRIATKRAALLQAWRVAQNRIDRDGVAQLTDEEEAGRLLEKWDGGEAAYVFATTDRSRELLADVVREEGGEVISPGRSVP